MSASGPEAQAFVLFRAGRFAEAEGAWRAILERAPDDPQALHMLGYILTRLGRADEGLALIDRSIERAPRAAAFLANRAQVLTELSRIEDALRDLRRAVQLEPRFVAAYCHLGSLLRRSERHDEALAAFRRAIAIDARSAEAHVGLGNVLRESGDESAARESYGVALAIDPGHASAHYNLGLSLLVGRELAAAEAAFRRTLEREPRNPLALNNLGVVLRDAGRADEALACFDAAARAQPDNVDALNNLGIALKDRGDLDAAAGVYARALALGASSPPLLLNAASVALDRGALDEAEGLYRRALAARPAWADAEYGLGQVALRRHDFAAGWRAYERRFETDPPQAIAREFAVPRLRAEDLDAAPRVAVWSEQGVGDQVLFSTLLPELAQRGIHAVVEVDERLAAMYRRSLPSLEFVARDASAAAFERCGREIPIGSLAHLFRNTADEFARQPAALLAPDPARVRAFRERLGEGRWVAISWRSLQGGGRRALAQRKSIPLEAFAALATAGVRLLDVQYGDVAEERSAFMERHPGLLTRLEDLDTYADLEGVAAAMAACEAVVTASNVTAHLAGAIGQRTHLVHLGVAPFSYWVPGASGRCLWYPSVEIAADPAWKRWEDAIERVRERLAR